MSKFVVVIFPTQAKAYEGIQALTLLQAEGTVALYGTAVISKNADGSVELKQQADSGPIGTALGVLSGGLIGLLGGPIAGAVGLTLGASLGSIGDLFNLGVGGDFLDQVAGSLTPGKSALVAELSEDWTTPLDVRMEALGGLVLRQWRIDVEYDQLDREVAATTAELDALKAEYEQSRDDTKANIAAKIADTKAKLKATSDKAAARLDQTQKETSAKVELLQDQAAKAQADQKARIQTRIDTLQANSQRRNDKLKQAWELAKDAFK